MECLGSLLSTVPCLWECSGKHAAYIVHLEDNLSSLSSALLKLKNISEDVRNKVSEAEQQRMKPRNQVNGWLGRVEAMERQVNLILDKGTRELENKCVGSCCPKNCRSSYNIGKKVVKMTPIVTELTEEGNFDVVADRLPPAAVEELPIDNVVMGFESKFEEVWQSVQNKDFAIIGLVGIGGAGKTTLLKQLNNEFLKTTHQYDLVVWVVVSRPVNLASIQDTIKRKINISDDLWENNPEEERASLIFNKLKNKRFVLLLDDVWDSLQLSEVGIPRPSSDSMSKVVITTRSRDVCRSMDAHKSIEVGCLPPEEAFKLFCSKVGEDMLKSHPKIHEMVKDVARECKGLPLALITIGRAMNGKTDAQQWKDAKMTLEKYTSTFLDMESRVFARLVFSYDSLPNPTLQKCFEYCSLYPEDLNIDEDEIIRLWLAEGLINEYDNMSHALLKGRQVLQSLVHASLLEIGEEEKTVKMHDVIRDMVLWVGCERGEKKDKYWINVNIDPNGFSGAPNVMGKWRTNTKKASVWGSCTTLESLVVLSSCSSLVTLIIQGTNLKELPGEVFESMKVLKVLDLSFNYKLMGLPIEIEGLSDLEYLNIRRTNIRKLPIETKQLKKLRFLRVDSMTIIPKDVISSLMLLQTFEQSNIESVAEVERISMEKEMLLELEALKHVIDLRLTLVSRTGFQVLLKSLKLQSCTSQLLLSRVEPLPDVIDLGEGTLTNHLKTLEVDKCDMSIMNLGRSSLGNNICHIAFFECKKIRNMSSLIHVPNLSFLAVYWCESMEELIGEETKSNVGTSHFSHLKTLLLRGLPKLRSICPQTALPFPSLEFMRVLNCDTLQKLPLDFNSANTTLPQLNIIGERDWWNGLEWDSQETKDAFTPKFRLRMIGI